MGIYLFVYGGNLSINILLFVEGVFVWVRVDFLICFMLLFLVVDIILILLRVKEGLRINFFYV